MNEEARQRKLKELQKQKDNLEYNRLLLKKPITMWEQTFWVVGLIAVICIAEWIGLI